jgi:hypothetical protein
MNPWKTLRLLGTFYRGYALPSLLFTASCLLLNWQADFRLFGWLFWGKVGSLGLLFGYIDGYKRPAYAYYHNLGLSRQRLWAVTLSVDISLFLALLRLCYPLR